MNRYFAVVLCSLAFGISPVWADDIEVYLAALKNDALYVNVVMDVGDTLLDREICTVGLSCAPPFMSAAAHRNLQDMVLQGDAVTAPGIFRAVLAAVLEKPQFDPLQVALVISNHQDNALDPDTIGQGGGTILQGYRPLGSDREQLIATLKSVPVTSGEQSHALQLRESYFEWLRYLVGGPVALGTNTRGNFATTNPVPDFDAGIIAQGSYVSPLAAETRCPGLYSLLFTQGMPSSDSNLDDEIAAALSLERGSTFTQMLSHLHAPATDLLPASELDVALQKTWVVTSRDRSGDAAAYAIAGRSGVPLYVDTPVALEQELIDALTGILSDNSHISATSFVADTFSPGRIRDDVFVAMFEARHRGEWSGNLKKLQLVDSSQTAGVASDDGAELVGRLVDARGNAAVETAGSQRGGLRFDALTFWTDVDTLPAGDGINVPIKADGPVVARGGAGQKIDGFVNYDNSATGGALHFIGDANTERTVDGATARQLYYEAASAPTLRAFDAVPATSAVLQKLLDPLDEMNEAELLDLIRWGRGQDVAAGKATARDWLVGEILHAKPYALNYGATPGYTVENPNIHLLVGSGDGLFHILENTSTQGQQTGREIFGFYPRELLGNLKTRRDLSRPPLQLPYGVDGSPVVLKNDRNGDGTLDHSAGDTAYVYFGLRRGGRSYFAFNISDPDALPILMWKIDPRGSSSFDTLGMTFSTPVVGKVSHNGVPIDVLVFAGGYNGGWNSTYTARRGKDLGAADDDSGNALFIVDAHSGELIWKAVQGVTGNRSNTYYEHSGLVDSIPSTVSVLTTPEDIIHRLYVGDTGGAVWRVDLPVATQADVNYRRDRWFVTKLADLGADAAEPGGSAEDDRRFFHAPDIVRTRDGIGSYDAVVIQSGDRAHPLDAIVQNTLFLLKDREVVTGSPAVRAENEQEHPAGRYLPTDLLDQTLCTGATADGSEVASDENCSAASLVHGWKVRYRQPGEKGLSSPLTDGGRIFASTFVPGNTAICPSQEGGGRMHVLRLDDGTAAANTLRWYDLGPGIPDAAMPVGDFIFVPGQGIEWSDLDGDGTRDSSNFILSDAARLYSIYWREPGIDPL